MAEGGPASCEESPGFLLVWEAWRRITKRGHEILKEQGGERGMRRANKHTHICLLRSLSGDVTLTYTHFLKTYPRP